MSLAGFNAGPVGPPSDTTKHMTRKPKPMKSARGSILSEVMATAPRTSRNVPRNSLMKPFNLLSAASIVEKVPKMAVVSVVCS